MSSSNQFPATESVCNMLVILEGLGKVLQDMTPAKKQFKEAENVISEARELMDLIKNEQETVYHHMDRRLRELVEAETRTFKECFHHLDNVLRGIGLPSDASDPLTPAEKWNLVTKIPSITALSDKLHRSQTRLSRYRTFTIDRGQMAQAEINELLKTAQDMFEAHKKKLIDMTLPSWPPNKASWNEWHGALEFEQNEINKGDKMLSKLQEYAYESALTRHNGNNIGCHIVTGGTNSGQSITNNLANFRK